MNNTDNPIQQQTPPIQPTPSGNQTFSNNPITNQKGNFLIMLGAIFIILVVGVGAYYLGTRKAEFNIQNTVTQQRTSTPSITQDSLLNTDSWLVASDQQARYYLKYPSNWKASKDTGGYLLSLVSPTKGLMVYLQQISTGSKEEIRNNLLKEKDNLAEYNKTSQTVQYNYTFEEKVFGQNTVFLVKRLVINRQPGYDDYVTAFVIDNTKVAQFVVTQNYTDPNIAQIIHTIYSTFKYDASLEGKSISFQSKELGITFSYPSELGRAHENPASQGKGGSQNKGEEWWRIDFNKTGFESGYYEVSASTSNYAPESWEGTPHWFNVKISTNDTEETLKQKLTTVNWQVIKVQKVQNAKGIAEFKVWTMDCYVGCILSRVYLVPLANSKYNNLLIYTILKSLNAGNENATLEQARNLAVPEITKIESNQADVVVKKYIEGQDLMFNSLTVGS